MCNINCIRWAAKNLAKSEITGKNIIEVGSYDVNGSLRYIVELLEPAKFVGVDIVKGPGVDAICPVENLVETFGKSSFDVVIATCVMEHIRDWKKAVSNIKNICKPGGIILIIVPSDWPYHEFPCDFWRYKKEDIKNIFSDCVILTIEEDSQKPSLIYSKIRKPDSFFEKDLSGHQLYSIIVKTRVNEIYDKDFKKLYFKRLVFMNRIKHLAKQMFSKLYNFIFFRT